MEEVVAMELTSIHVAVHLDTQGRYAKQVSSFSLSLFLTCTDKSQESLVVDLKSLLCIRRCSSVRKSFYLCIK